MRKMGKNKKRSQIKSGKKSNAYCQNAVLVPLKTASLAPIGVRAVVQGFVGCFHVQLADQCHPALSSTMVLVVDSVHYYVPKIERQSL